jgi:hypothetical protein
MATAMRHMVLGAAFIAGFLGIVMTIPMVGHGPLGVVTNGISPMVSIASFH